MARNIKWKRPQPHEALFPVRCTSPCHYMWQQHVRFTIAEPMRMRNIAAACAKIFHTQKALSSAWVAVVRSSLLGSTPPGLQCCKCSCSKIRQDILTPSSAACTSLLIAAPTNTMRMLQTAPRTLSQSISSPWPFTPLLPRLSILPAPCLGLPCPAISPAARLMTCCLPVPRSAATNITYSMHPTSTAQACCITICALLQLPHESHQGLVSVSFAYMISRLDTTVITPEGLETCKQPSLTWQLIHVFCALAAPFLCTVHQH